MLEVHGYETIITHRRSMAERSGCFQRRLFVCLLVCLFGCQHDNFRTMKDDETWRLGAFDKNLARVRIWSHRPHPWVPNLKIWRLVELLRKKINKRIWAWQTWQWATPPHPSVNK